MMLIPLRFRNLDFWRGAAPTRPLSQPAAENFSQATSESLDACYEQEENQEEVTKVEGWKPSITLQLKDGHMFGEEDEQELFCQRLKLFRFGAGTWHLCGWGEAKLLKHPATGVARFLFRLDSTQQILANHCIFDIEPYCQLQSNNNSDNCLVWTAPDCSKGSVTVRHFGVKFRNEEDAAVFREKFEFAKDESHRDQDRLDAVEEVPPPRETRLARELGAPAAHRDEDHLACETHELGARAAHPESPEQTDEESCVHAEEEIAHVPGWSPSVTLFVGVIPESGEENEEQRYCHDAKLFKFRRGAWNYCGMGQVKLLTSNTTGQTRFLFRLHQTMKLLANHFLVDCPPYCHLEPNASSERCWVWAALDCASGVTECTRFALKFADGIVATEFKAAFNEAKTPSIRRHAGPSVSNHEASHQEDHLQFETCLSMAAGSESALTDCPDRRGGGISEAPDATAGKGQEVTMSTAELLERVPAQTPSIQSHTGPSVSTHEATHQEDHLPVETCLSMAADAESAPTDCVDHRGGGGISEAPDATAGKGQEVTMSTAELLETIPVQATPAYSRKNAHVGSRGSWDLHSGSEVQNQGSRSEADDAALTSQKKRTVSTSNEGEPRQNVSRKLMKAHEEATPSRAETTQAQLALTSVTQLLIEAHGINTNEGAKKYKDIIQQARELALTSRGDASLSGRIYAAAFAPHPTYGSWRSNTPSWHQGALKELITALGMVSLIEFLQAAINIDTVHGSVACYRKLIERAFSLADAIDAHKMLRTRIDMAAFKPFPTTGTWAPNMPSCHREALSKLIHILALGKIRRVLEKAIAINTNHGSTRYKELVQQAQDVAEASKMDPALSGRIEAAAFAPLPRTGRWMPNTPGCHQEALQCLWENLRREQKRKESEAGPLA